MNITKALDLISWLAIFLFFLFSIFIVNFYVCYFYIIKNKLKKIIKPLLNKKTIKSMSIPILI